MHLGTVLPGVTVHLVSLHPLEASTCFVYAHSDWSILEIERLSVGQGPSSFTEKPEPYYDSKQVLPPTFEECLEFHSNMGLSRGVPVKERGVESHTNLEEADYLEGDGRKPWVYLVYHIVVPEGRCLNE